MHLAISTISPGDAPDFARRLVDEGLVACVNIVPGVRSIYSWKGEIQDDEECVLLAKTARDSSEFEARFVELHPYECPELLLVPIGDGHQPYLDWVAKISGTGKP